MNKNTLIALLVLGITVLIRYFIFSPTRMPTSQAELAGQKTVVNQEGMHGTSASANPEGSGKRLDQADRKLNVPIKFYGRVVDQDGRGISGAVIHFSILGIHAFPGSIIGNDYNKIGQVTSSNEGAFEIGGETATSMSIDKIDKAGYRQPKQLRGTFGYAGNPNPFQSNNKEPVTFTLFDERKIPTLVTFDKMLTFSWDGEPRHYDIMTGLPTPDGMIEIVPKRARFAPNNRFDFDWSLAIRIVGGGIVSVEKQHGNVAPEAGYVSSLTFGNGKGNIPLGNSSIVTLYAKLPSGNFARLLLTIYQVHDDNSFGAVLKGFINPIPGSRVLEFVPSLQLRDK